MLVETATGFLATIEILGDAAIGDVASLVGVVGMGALSGCDRRTHRFSVAGLVGPLAVGLLVGGLPVAALVLGTEMNCI